MINLSEDVKVVRVMDAVAAGTSNQTGTTIDTADYDGCMFVAAFGTLSAGAVTSLKAQGGAKSDGSDAADLAGTNTAIPQSDSNGCVLLDIFRPQQRYLTPVVLRGTGNAVIDGVFAILYRGRNKPVALDATVAARTVLASPAPGTP